MNHEENIKRFEELFSGIKRSGAERVLNYIRQSDFYTAPASTKYHLCVEGGLLQHSLDVYHALQAEKKNPIWGNTLEKVSEETLLIVSLLHDLCKTFFYAESTKNVKKTVPCYTVENKYPLGHGSKSVIFIMKMMPLTMEEITAIYWHMGAYCDQGQWNELGEAYKKFPLALALHHADMVATYLMEKEG